MHIANSIIMQAPREVIFETAANLESWPKILPHYRYIRYLERGLVRNVVVMAAVRSGFRFPGPPSRLSIGNISGCAFIHLKAWTKGMRVLWIFEETEKGVLVKISHDLQFRIRALAPIAEKIIRQFFIEHVAARTLRCMTAYLEARETPVRHVGYAFASDRALNR